MDANNNNCLINRHLINPPQTLSSSKITKKEKGNKINFNLQLSNPCLFYIFLILTERVYDVDLWRVDD